jgi:hypothetical protein
MLSAAAALETPAMPKTRTEAVRIARKRLFIGLSSLSYSNGNSIRLVL